MGRHGPHNSMRKAFQAEPDWTDSGGVASTAERVLPVSRAGSFVRWLLSAGGTSGLLTSVALLGAVADGDQTTDSTVSCVGQDEPAGVTALHGGQAPASRSWLASPGLVQAMNVGSQCETGSWTTGMVRSHALPGHLSEGQGPVVSGMVFGRGRNGQILDSMDTEVLLIRPPLSLAVPARVLARGVCNPLGQFELELPWDGGQYGLWLYSPTGMHAPAWWPVTSLNGGGRLPVAIVAGRGGSLQVTVSQSGLMDPRAVRPNGPTLGICAIG